MKAARYSSDIVWTHRYWEQKKKETPRNVLTLSFPSSIGLQPEEYEEHGVRRDNSPIQYWMYTNHTRNAIPFCASEHDAITYHMSRTNMGTPYKKKFSKFDTYTLDFAEKKQQSEYRILEQIGRCQ